MADEKPSFSAWLKAFWTRICGITKAVIQKIELAPIHWPIATIVTIFLVAGATILLVSGKTFQIGGLLGKIWGSKSTGPTLTPPPGRVDDKGNVIEPGTPDPVGFVQASVVLPVKDPGIFSNPNTVVVTKPDGNDVTLQLPTGVKNSDVQQVVMVNENVYQLANNDTGVDVKSILKELP